MRTGSVGAATRELTRSRALQQIGPPEHVQLDKTLVPVAAEEWKSSKTQMGLPFIVYARAAASRARTLPVAVNRYSCLGGLPANSDSSHLDSSHPSSVSRARRG